MYLSPRLAGSRARSCGERREGVGEEQQRRRRLGTGAPPPALLCLALPCPPAGRAPAHLHEEFHGALGHVQVAGAQVRALVHGGGRVYEEQEDRHGPGGPRAGRPAAPAVPARHRSRRLGEERRDRRAPLAACLAASVPSRALNFSASSLPPPAEESWGEGAKRAGAEAHVTAARTPLAGRWEAICIGMEGGV